MFAPRKKIHASSQQNAYYLKPGKNFEGMFWFDGFGNAQDRDYSGHWYRIKLSAGKEEKLQCWTNRYLPHDEESLRFVYSDNTRITSVRRKRIVKNGKNYVQYRFTAAVSGWGYVFIGNPSHYEKMYSIMVM